MKTFSFNTYTSYIHTQPVSRVCKHIFHIAQLITNLITIIFIHILHLKNTYIFFTYISSSTTSYLGCIINNKLSIIHKVGQYYCSTYYCIRTTYLLILSVINFYLLSVNYLNTNSNISQLYNISTY